MVLLSRRRDPRKVFHGSQRGKNLAAEPRIQLGLDHRQEPHQPPLSPTRDVRQQEVCLVSSVDIMFSIFDVLDL